MRYLRTTWVGGPDGTEITSARLNNIETGLSVVSSPWDLFPDRGALVGVSCQTRAPLTNSQTVAEHEALIGKDVDIWHVYHWLGTTFPTADEAARAAKGQIILTSVQFTNVSGVMSWADVVAGNYDTDIIRYANDVKSLAPFLVMVSVENEPELNLGAVGVTNSDGKTGKGTAAEYKAAAQRFITIFREQGVTNALHCFIAAGIMTTNKQTQVSGCWPGAAYIDVMAFDPYNRISDGWKTFDQTIGPWYNWARTNLAGASTMPWMLGEYGTEENPSDQLGKFAWFLQAAAATKAGTYPLLKALIYFDHSSSSGSGDWWIDTSAQSIAGYRMLVDQLWNPYKRADVGDEIFVSGDYYWAESGGSVSTSNTLNNGELRLAPWDVRHPLPLEEIGVTVTAAGSTGALFRPAIYADNGSGTYPGALLLDPGTVSAAAIAVPGVTGLTNTLKPGRYWRGGAVQGAPATQPTMRVSSNSLSLYNRIGNAAPSSATNAPLTGVRVTGVTGALPSTFPAGALTAGSVPLVHVRVR